MPELESALKDTEKRDLSLPSGAHGTLWGEAETDTGTRFYHTGHLRGKRQESTDKGGWGPEKELLNSTRDEVSRTLRGRAFDLST